ncbi:MAG: hypothetical protein ACKOWJ_01060 [Micrococcales bacterium]
MSKKEAKQKRKWGWADSVIAVSVALIALVGFTVWSGTVGKQQADQQSDKTACVNFNNALSNAYKTTTAKDFYWTLFRGAYAGIDQTREKTAINDDFIALAQLEAYVDNTTWNSMLVTVGDATSAVQADCAVVLKVDVNKWSSAIPHASGSAAPAASASPSASAKN